VSLLALFLSLSYSLIAEIFASGDWDLGTAGLPANDPQILGLMREFCQSVAQSRAASTFNTYQGPWAGFKAFCASKGVPSLSASPLVVALYFTLLLRTTNSPSPILACSVAIFSFLSIASFASPTSHPMVKMAREIANRTKLVGQNARKPFLASHICKLFELWHQPEGTNLHELMKVVAITLCFVGFSRYSDLMVQLEELLFFPTHMELFIEKSKTDQYCKGRWVLIARVGGPFRPVALVEELLFEGVYLGAGPFIRSTCVFPRGQYFKAQQPCYTTVNA
jgi:hypothetical protein